MNDHDKLNPLLPFYLAGTLDPKQTAAVKAHLEVCPICADDLVFWQEMEGTIQADIAPFDAPQHVLNNTLSLISEENEKPNPLTRSWRIMWAQVPMFCREIWPTSLLVLLLGFVMTLLTDRAGVLFAIAPLVSVAGLAYIYNESSDPAFELVLSTPISQIQLLLARSSLVFGFNLVSVGLLGLTLALHFSPETILTLLKSWLAPMTFLSIFGLCLSLFTRPGNAIAVAYALWLTQYLPLTEEFQQLFARLAEGILWFWQTPKVLFIFSSILLAFIIFWIMKGSHFSRHLA